MKVIRVLTELLREITYQLKKVANEFTEQRKILEEINRCRNWKNKIKS